MNLKITRGTVGDDGGCICCDAHRADANGNTPRAEPINLIRASGSEIRACDACLPRIGAACMPLTPDERATVERVREGRESPRLLLAILDRVAGKE